MRFIRRISIAMLALVVATVGVVAVRPAPAAAAPVIVCQLRVDTPHHSLHVPGTINVTARTWCTAPVGIAVVLSLFRNGVAVSTNRKWATSATVININTATPCVRGTAATFQGRGAAHIVYPQGGEPDEEVISANSITVTLLCP